MSIVRCLPKEGIQWNIIIIIYYYYLLYWLIGFFLFSEFTKNRPFRDKWEL